MATRIGKTKVTIAIAAALAMTMASGCSHHKPADAPQQADAANAPAPDAGTDAVPQATVEDRSGNPSADVPPPPAPDNSASVTAEAPTAPPPAPDQTTPEQTAQAAPPAPAAPAATAPAATANDQSNDHSSDQAPAAAPAVADENGNYTVQSGDTLMKIAFDNYGDLYKWKDIYEANKDHIHDPNALAAGTVLKIAKADTPVTIERNGDQYRIKSGDTLGSISKDVYGTSHKWKKILENNKQLIKDPNKIYAGFYLYYTLDSKERLGYEKRHGGSAPSPVADAAPVPAPLAAATQPRMPASLPPVQPASASPQTPASAQHATNTGAVRQPASTAASAAALPPVIDARTLTGGPVAPPPPEMSNVPPPMQHSADLNEVIRQAQQQAASQAAAAGAGP